MSYERLYWANRAFTTLAAAMDDSQETCTLADGMPFPEEGDFLLSVDSEIIHVGTIVRATGACTDLTRGYEGTTAAAHEEAAIISNKLTAGAIDLLYTGVDAAIAAVDDKLNLAGGTMTGDVDFDSNTISNVTIENATFSTGESGSLDFNNEIMENAVLQSYRETVVTVTPELYDVTKYRLTLNCSLGNVFVTTITTSIDEMLITNAPTDNAFSITLEILYASSTLDYFFTWVGMHTVEEDATDISTATADKSFNSAGNSFSTSIEAGDTINVQGFTVTGTDATANNIDWKVVSATAAKIVVYDPDDVLVQKTAGDEVTIGRRKAVYRGGVVPDAPEPYTPKTFTMYSTDGDRWRIAEVGEF